MDFSKTSWFVIVNPTSGNGSGKKNWATIQNLLNQNGFTIKYEFTKYHGHSVPLVQNAIKNGYHHFISVGGDGTLHNIINGIMTQSHMLSTKVKVGVIPIGTGNDWVKNYNISKKMESAIKVIKDGFTLSQDIGRINFTGYKRLPIYFLNAAGVGFDGFVVSNVERYKRFGVFTYLIGALKGLFYFNNFQSRISFNSETIETETFMITIGICKFSGGGMQLTRDSNSIDGVFDISIAKDFSKLDVIRNLANLFNGQITKHKKVISFKTDTIMIHVDDENPPYIQADGELIGVGNFEATVIPEAISFFIPKTLP